MRYGSLISAKRGDVVLMASANSLQTWRVVEVRDVRDARLSPDTFRLRPELVRSTHSVLLRNAKTGRLRTQYHANTINAVINPQFA
jgi:hypothetical protein